MADERAGIAPATDPTLPEHYLGVVDRLAQGRLSGWAVTGKGQPCVVTIRIDDIPVATVISNQPRPDLVAKKLSNGLGGWICDLGEALAADGSQIELLFPDGVHLTGSPIVCDEGAREPIVLAPIDPAAPLTYVGAIDTPDEDMIGGWAIGSDFRAASVVIQVNDHPPVTVAAEHDRADLIAQQLTRSGGGWVFDVAALLVFGANRISITFPDGLDLPGSPIERNVAHPSAPGPADMPESRPGTPGFRKPAPGPDPSLAATPPPSNVTPFPSRANGPASMPSLAELDEISLDDLSLAVATGMITIEARPAPEPVPPPVPLAVARERSSARHEPGILARLLRQG